MCYYREIINFQVVTVTRWAISPHLIIFLYQHAPKCFIPYIYVYKMDQTASLENPISDLIHVMLVENR